MILQLEVKASLWRTRYVLDNKGIGPVYAIAEALKLAGLTLHQIDLIDLKEGFAAQSVSVMKVLGLTRPRSTSTGPGARLTVTVLPEMKHRKAKYGIVTMCVGGGMGAAGIFENIT